MDLRARMAELAKIGNADAPVVSVYLDTRWSDEHQRDRVRIFLKNEIAKARDARKRRAAPGDLEWIESAGGELVIQAVAPDTRGVALFACESAGLRELLRFRTPFANSFAVDDTPYLAPLIAAVQQTPATLVAFVDTDHARLMHVTPEGLGDEIALATDMPGHHNRGEWVQFAQLRYERHVREHRGRHLAAVAESLGQLMDAHGVERLVLAGDPRTLSALRRELLPRMAAHIVGEVSASRHESSSVIVDRAVELISHRPTPGDAPAVDAVLTEAAKSGQAVAGLEETVDAVNRGAVRRLYVLRGTQAPASACSGCGSLFSDVSEECRLCGEALQKVELGEALVHRVLAASGTVETVEAHQRLAAVGGVAALLRYPL